MAIKIGIIGTGRTIGIAESHVLAYKANPKVELKALFDTNREMAVKWAEDKGLQGVTIASTIEEFFGLVDAVSICVPNNQHFDIMKKCIEAKKHFICEKPMATSYEEAKKMADCANAVKEITSMICFNYRDIPAVKYAKKLINEGFFSRVYSCRQQLGGGRIADPVNVKREWRMDKDRSGTGALADFGCHMLDIEDFLLKDIAGEIVSVNCMTETIIKERISDAGDRPEPVTNDDCAIFSARTANGALLSFLSSRIGMPYQTLEIIGDGGMILFNSSNINQLGIQRKDKNGGYKEPLQYVSVPDEFFGGEGFRALADGHKGIINEFADCILNSNATSRDLNRGCFIQELLEKFSQAARENCTIAI